MTLTTTPRAVPAAAAAAKIAELQALVKFDPASAHATASITALLALTPQLDSADARVAAAQFGGNFAHTPQQRHTAAALILTHIDACTMPLSQKADEVAAAVARAGNNMPLKRKAIAKLNALVSTMSAPPVRPIHPTRPQHIKHRPTRN